MSAAMESSAAMRTSALCAPQGRRAEGLVWRARKCSWPRRHAAEGKQHGEFWAIVAVAIGSGVLRERVGLRPVLVRRGEHWRRGSSGTARAAGRLENLGLSPTLLALAKRAGLQGDGSKVVLLVSPTHGALLDDPVHPLPLSELAGTSVDFALDVEAGPGVWWTGDPSTSLPPPELLTRFRELARIVAPGGRLLFVSRSGPNSPLGILMASTFAVCAQQEEGMWLFDCRRHSEARVVTPPVRGAICSLLGGGEDTAKAPLAVWTRNPAEAELMYREIFLERCYSPVDLPVAQMHTFPVFVDAGMNIGLFSLYLHQHVGRGCCLAFEPAPESYAIALRNLRDAGVRVVDHGDGLPTTTALESREIGGNQITVHAFMMALSDLPYGEEETLSFYPLTSANSTFRRMLPGPDADPTGGAYREEVLVRCCRLAEALDSLRPALPSPLVVELLKVDVEGAEVEVLHGLAEEDWRSVRRLAVEVADEETATRVHGLVEASEFNGHVAVSPHPELPNPRLVHGIAAV